MQTTIRTFWYSLAFFLTWAFVGAVSCKTPLPEPNAITITETDSGTEACIRFAQEKCPCWDAGKE